MMDIPGTGRFGVYEVLRILLPGYYVMLLAYVYAAAFALPVFPFDTWEIGLPTFFLGGVVAGLTLYAKESPKKRKAFQSNQPSRYILERSRTVKKASPLTEEEARRVYFYILNEHMPSTVHDKIFFFGMIYHIMISIRRTSFWFGMLGLIILAIYLATGGRLPFQTLLSVALVWMVYALNVRYNKADRKMQENYQDQILWLAMNEKIVNEVLTRRMRVE